MPNPFPDLRERLLKAGVAPGRVRRLLTELSEHHADLVAEGVAAGLGPEEARAAASVRVGGADELARAITGRPELQSWRYRAPWACFGLLPLLSLGGCYFAACFILWSGWKIFLPGLPSPFVPVAGSAALYFCAGRLLFFGSPLLVGWASALLADRQRLAPGWPAAGIALVALAGSAAQVHAFRAGAADQVEMALTLGRSLAAVGSGLLHAGILFALAALPLLVGPAARALRPAGRD